MFVINFLLFKTAAAAVFTRKLPLIEDRGPTDCISN